MKAHEIYEAMDGIDDRTLLETVSTFHKDAGRVIKPHRVLKTVLVAAVIVSVFACLSVAAYAGNFLGIRALLRPDEYDADGNAAVSITAPQQMPDELPEETKALIESSENAWNEWMAYKDNESACRLPAAFQNLPESYCYIDEKENSDGSWTVSFYNADYDEAEDELINQALIKEINASAEDYNAWKNIQNGVRFGDYDYSYAVMSEEDGEKLESIADKYHLNLRRGRKVVWSSETMEMTGDNFYTNKELAEMTADIGCSGSIFYETPVGFDKMYWFNEGTFCASYYVDLPSSGTRATCYLRNNPYSTMTGGGELGDSLADTEGFSERSYTASDGTELTILSNGRDAYIYVYLDNSYVVDAVSIDPVMTEDEVNLTADAVLADSDLDYIADYINYSLIG